LKQDLSKHVWGKEDIANAKKIRRELKASWANLWTEKHDDKKKAEGLSTDNYENLDMDRGQVIYATRDYKPLNFRQIYEEKVGKAIAEKASPHPSAGGWGKFARENFGKKWDDSERERPDTPFDPSQQQRKHGKGWLNRIRIEKKKHESSE
jgi:hypothetical protein